MKAFKKQEEEIFSMYNYIQVLIFDTHYETLMTKEVLNNEAKATLCQQEKLAKEIKEWKIKQGKETKRREASSDNHKSKLNQ